METSPIKIRTCTADADHVRAAWQSERARLRRLVGDRMRRHLKAEGWPTGPDAEHVDVPPRSCVVGARCAGSSWPR